MTDVVKQARRDLSSLWKGNCRGAGASFNSEGEKLRVLLSRLKSPESRISSSAVYVKFLFSYGNIPGKAFKSQRGNTDFIENICRIRHLLGSWREALLQMLPRKRIIHVHNFKLHFFSAEQESKRVYKSFKSIKIPGILLLTKAINQTQRKEVHKTDCCI